MSEIACIFPGQGSQYVGMGRDIFDSWAVARETFEEADRFLGYDLSRICFNGPEDELRQTRFTQLAILVHSVAAWRIIEGEGLRPKFLAGHSVGEYSALVASCCLSFRDALKLVQVRAEAMYSCGIERAGAMAALIGMAEDKLDRLLTEARKVGIIEPANYNSPLQIVVSGEETAVDRAVEIARSFGAKRAIRLNVSGAFHSPLMEIAEDKLAKALANVSFSNAAVPVISNVTARTVTEPQEIVNLLRKQLTKPVLWHQSMEYLIGRGVTLFAEVGPGNVLRGLLRRIKTEAQCLSCSDVKGIETFFQEVCR